MTVRNVSVDHESRDEPLPVSLNEHFVIIVDDENGVNHGCCRLSMGKEKKDGILFEKKNSIITAIMKIHRRKSSPFKKTGSFNVIYSY